MGLQEKIDNDLKEAMLSRQNLKVSVIRLLKASLKNEEIRKKRQLQEEEILSIIQSESNKRKDSIEQFKKGGREDLVKKEEEELSLLSAYLPKQLTESEVRSLIKGVIDEKNISGEKNFGLLMKEIMPKVKGKADGGLVSNLVKEMLKNSN